MDALGSAIRIDARGREVVRILPRVNDAVNEEWISDKTRHIVDGLKTQRLDRPYVRVDGRLRPANWAEAFATIAAKIAAAVPARVGAIVGDLATVEEMFALKVLIAKLGSSNIDCRQDGSRLHPKFGRASYIFNSTIAGVDQADAILIVGSIRVTRRLFSCANPKALAQGQRANRRRRPQRQSELQLQPSGAGPETLAQAWDRPPKDTAKPMMIVGPGAFARPDGVALLAGLAKTALAAGVVKDGWNGFNVLHTAASRVGGLDLGLVPGEDGLDALTMTKAHALDVLINLGADEIDIGPGAFVVYIGTHGDRGAHRADVVSAGTPPTLKRRASTSTPKAGRSSRSARCSRQETRVRIGRFCVRCRRRWAPSCHFDSLAQLRAALAVAHPFLVRFDVVAPADASIFHSIASLGGAADRAAFVPAISDFYLTNPIARASRVMAECSALARGVQRQAAE